MKDIKIILILEEEFLQISLIQKTYQNIALKITY